MGIWYSAIHRFYRPLGKMVKNEFCIGRESLWLPVQFLQNTHIFSVAAISLVLEYHWLVLCSVAVNNQPIKFKIPILIWHLPQGGSILILTSYFSVAQWNPHGWACTNTQFGSNTILLRSNFFSLPFALASSESDCASMFLKSKMQDLN